MIDEQSHALLGTPTVARPARVLVADDSSPIRLLARINLTAAGFEVFEAVDGLDALAKAAEHDPHVVVLDWMMPHLDGIEVAKALVSQHGSSARRCAIVMLTARSTSEDVDRAREAGASGYVTKPFLPDELTTVVREQARQVTAAHRER